ncbi:MAG: hypothetical protein CL472_01875 [Acidobacteria bacterium]|nr:hypothetical protein [Acidobacteriota bacterium]
MILKQTDDKQGDIDILHNLAAQASSTRQRYDIQSEIDNIVSGVRGETDASYYLDQEFRHRDDVVVIHDLRIEEEGDIAQIDHIVINRRRQAIVLETKALKAEISCNEEGEWEAVYGSQRYSIASPLEQCKRHAAVLRRWLARRKTALREVIPVVLAAPTTRIGRRASDPDDPEVVKSDLFPRWFEKTSKANSNIITIGDDKMSEDELAGIGYRLLRAHTPIQFDWRKRFGFPSNMEIQIEKKDENEENPSLEIAPPPPAGKDEEKPDRRKHIGKTIVPIDGGSITIFRYENEDRGIRCDDDSLKDKVAELCRQNNGRWVPFPRFWLVSFSACQKIVSDLGGQKAPQPKTPPEPQTDSSASSDTTPEKKRDLSASSIPESIPTIHGDITIRLTQYGYAVRTPRHVDIIEVIKDSCKGVARWNRRYQNWLVPKQQAPEVCRSIIDGLKQKSFDA